MQGPLAQRAGDPMHVPSEQSGSARGGEQRRGVLGLRGKSGVHIGVTRRHGVGRRQLSAARKTCLFPIRGQGGNFCCNLFTEGSDGFYCYCLTFTIYFIVLFDFYRLLMLLFIFFCILIFFSCLGYPSSSS